MEARHFIQALVLSTSSLLISSSYAASTGVFAGGGIGYGKINTPDENVFSNASALSGDTNRVNRTIHDIGGLSGTVFMGYNFSKYFGIEASYNQFSTSEYESNQSSINSDGTTAANADSTIKFMAHSFNLVGRGYLTFDNGIELFGRGGVAYVHQDEHYTTTTTNASYTVPVNNDKLATPDTGTTTVNKLRPTAGIGLGYHFNKNIGIGFAWNYIFGEGNLKTDKQAVANLQMLTFDMTYTFA